MLETVTVTRKKGKNSGNIRFKHLFSIKALGPARLNRHTQEKVFQHGGKLFDGKMHGAGPRRGYRRPPALSETQPSWTRRVDRECLSSRSVLE